MRKGKIFYEIYILLYSSFSGGSITLEVRNRYDYGEEAIHRQGDIILNLNVTYLFVKEFYYSYPAVRRSQRGAGVNKNPADILKQKNSY